MRLNYIFFDLTQYELSLNNIVKQKPFYSWRNLIWLDNKHSAQAFSEI